MSKHANPTLIGSFVIGAIVLAVVTILLLSSGSLFAQHPNYVMYFQESVKGLSIGAPVTFNGVKIGAVKNISVQADLATRQFLVPVIVELEPERMTLVHGTTTEAHERFAMPALIDRGLRAQLQLQSLLTGQLYIQVDFYPDKPATFVAKNTNIPEIPTIPTPLQEIRQKFENFPISQVLDDVSNTMKALNKLTNSAEIPKAMKKLNETMVSLDATLVSVRNTIGEGSPIVYQLNETLQEVNKAARSVHNLADTLERQPEALLKGKRSDDK
jgi:paraquat-inducible protein B